MNKRLFEVLDEMNQDDTTNNTKMVQVSNSLISADKVKHGGKVTMGVPEDALYQLIEGKVVAVLILVDNNEYFKRQGQ